MDEGANNDIQAVTVYHISMSSRSGRGNLRIAAIPVNCANSVRQKNDNGMSKLHQHTSKFFFYTQKALVEEEEEEEDAYAPRRRAWMKIYVRFLQIP